MSDLTAGRPARIWRPGRINKSGIQLWYSEERKALPRMKPADMFQQLSASERALVIGLLKAKA